MSSTINTNLASLATQRHAQRTEHALATTIARLATGLRINGARDDAARLAIADRFTAQIRGLDQAGRNATTASRSRRPPRAPCQAWRHAAAHARTRRAVGASAANAGAARSRIADANFAIETAQLTRSRILQDAAMAMLAQTSASASHVLTLLKG